MSETTTLTKSVLAIRSCSVCQLYDPHRQECNYELAFFISPTSRSRSIRSSCDRTDVSFVSHEIVVDSQDLVALNERIIY